MIPLSSIRQISAAEQRTVVQQTAHLIETSYVYKDIACDAAQRLLLDDGLHSEHNVPLHEWLAVLNAALFDILNDKHCIIKQQISSEEREYRRKISNYGITEVRLLEGGIGYLQLTAFSGNKHAAELLCAALTLLQHAESLIIDVRNNSGGSPYLVQVLMTALLKGGIHHINTFRKRKGDMYHETEFWTLPYIPAPSLHDKKLAVLCSATTFSAAEEFCYNVQVWKRGHLFGEPTAGAAHPGEWFPLPAGLTVYVPTGEAINPITLDNWEEKGVIPDTVLPAKNSLEKAIEWCFLPQ